MYSPYSDGSSNRRVSPFGYPRLFGYVLLNVAFRSLSRPSSAPSAKAFTLCSFFLDPARLLSAVRKQWTAGVWKACFPKRRLAFVFIGRSPRRRCSLNTGVRSASSALALACSLILFGTRECCLFLKLHLLRSFLLCLIFALYSFSLCCFQ